MFLALEHDNGRGLGISQSPSGILLELIEPGQPQRVLILTPAQQVRLAGLLLASHCGGVDSTGAMLAMEAFAAEWKRKVGR